MRGALWTLGRWPAAKEAAWTLQRTPVRAHAVAASVSHSLVACADHVLATGQAAGGALGTAPDAQTWTQHTLPGRATLLAAGAHTSWFGTRDALYGCGASARGQLAGAQHTVPPARLATPPADEVHAGLDHVVLRAGHDVYTFNTDGQLGRADAGRFDRTLRRVALPPVEWVRAGGDTSLARTADGVYVWGNTEYGQACLPGDQLRTPQAMPLDVDVADARLGGSFALFRTDAGDVYSVGYGATGHGAADARRVPPVRRVALPARATCIGAGLELAAAATRDGVYVWGVWRTAHGARHLPVPTHVPGSEAVGAVAALAATRDALLVLAA
ncbi:hypothetical protein CBS9595_000440 [Malassezia furfur]|nr:hypothetical protein CBS9595_000440 [Malassezia furfur]